jgi:hypothetical protein
MSAKPVGRKLFKVRSRSRSHGIQVNVPDQFLEIGVFLAQHGLETILKQGAVTKMPAIEISGVPRHEAPHDMGDSGRRAAEQKMGCMNSVQQVFF